ncbi:hypothetical protein N7478_006148 [Penicillium angulare]|uniref:uncharacterized protein n=1 Tax=Penicillium angulare TaxID=116970 RepID=UPI002540D04D|nr:uncharacterized protein N7478_006148 [Penicillium angulare]KAJ5280776.1 hypothetical protein N7478_006148 [Penicillium angulare]
MKRTISSDDEDGHVRLLEKSQPSQILLSLKKSVSPPHVNRTLTSETKNECNLAKIEAGETKVTNHLEIFSSRFEKISRPISGSSTSTPRLLIPKWMDLYRRNEHAEGRHFVIHQHDHPVAGPHYDLRLQFSETSSVSWSIMYGLPGDPNSQRLNRNATETRVHCLWNHLVETASSKTGSMIIWDTGEYEVLPYDADQSQPQTDDSRSEISDSPSCPEENISETSKLQQAFSNCKIRLRLHGTRLPEDYTVILRMDKTTNYKRPLRTGPKRRRKAPASKQSISRAPSTSESESENAESSEAGNMEATDSDNETDIQIQKNNAYPGSVNKIGSIHQRRWFLSLDRQNSGFELGNPRDQSASNKRAWARRLGRHNILHGFEPFHVRGPDFERSVVTGRLGLDVLNDEMVEGFIPRKGWRAVLH